MFHKSFPLLVIALWGIIVLPFPNQVKAITPLTRAEIQSLRNLVQLIPRNRDKKRPARKSDAMTPGDGLSTGRASLADLRFNDGSLARVGEQAIFQFLPNTRNFRVSNGTALLLIPPGRGQTLIQTPSAAAAIRGSALFVRYNQETDTTIVGALTNSGIEVSNKEASQTQVLQAGQMMVIVKGKFQGLYDFDLRNFYETSDMVRGLDLTKQNLTPTADPAIASVQAETVAALNAQTPITGEGVVENPSFAELTTSPSNSSTDDIITDNSSLDPIKDDSPLNLFEDIGQVLSNTEQRRSERNSNNNNVSTQNNNVVSTPTPVVSTPTPVVTTPTPVVSTPTPVVSTPTPVVSTPPPVEPTTPPVVTTPPPVVSTPTPVEPTTPPVVSTPTPVVPTTPPVVSTPTPVEPTTPPVVSTPTPVVPTTPPVVSTPTPVEPTTPPVVSTPTPVVPTSPPVEPPPKRPTT
ncbi:MAG: FecR family protein [Nostoc sp.]|uniref:FecR family protein n=1 Tax=Nostoc sp. TaxID=1180 RepID=UPI002FFD14E6